MPNANDLRKTITDATPLYFAAGVIDKIREEAPQRIAAVREADPKEFQARFTQQAKETQAKVSETLGLIDTDIKKLREQAQHLALQGVGFAAEYAVKARETYDELTVRGREAVKNWRGEDGDEITEVTVEREPVKVAEPPAGTEDTGTGPATAAKSDAEPKDASASKNASASKDTAAATDTKDATDATDAKDAKSAPKAASTAKRAGTARKTTTPRKTAPKNES